MKPTPKDLDNVNSLMLGMHNESMRRLVAEINEMMTQASDKSEDYRKGLLDVLVHVKGKIIEKARIK